ncbi:MAG TPA: hypothetical protein PLU30_03875 [Verrucomicrobiae bacterium]|nr:hypothetical protein [Verrucomicrobiae bacterium]
MSGQEKKNAEACLALPFDGHWELWALPRAAAPRLRVPQGDPARFPLSANATLALPTTALTCLPLWLLTSDAEQIPGMIRLQLEQRGLVGGEGPEPVHAFRIVPQDTHADRSLVLLVLLRDDAPNDLCRADFQRFDAAPRCLNLPPDQYTLWRELDRLVLALTRGRDPIFFQPLCATDPSIDLCTEIRCIHMSLAAQRIAPAKPSLTIWAGVEPAALELLQHELGFPVTTARRPPPRLPAPAWNIMPHAVRAEQERRKQAKRTSGIVAIAAVLYLLGIGAFVAHIALLKKSVEASRVQLHVDQPAVERIRDAASRWNAMELALDPQLNPLEFLLQATDAMAPEGVRMTQFQLSGYKLRIEGEARPPTAFVAYREHIEHHAFFSGFRWERAEPVIEANNIAKFSIQGSHPYAPTDKK